MHVSDTISLIIHHEYRADLKVSVVTPKSVHSTLDRNRPGD